MGLLDSVLGSVLGSQQSAGEGPAGLLGMLLGNPQLLQAIASLLGNEGALGGLGGLMAKFDQAGLGEILNSWVGPGQNQPISGHQLTEVLGAGTLADLATRTGTSSGDMASQLSQILPGLIDQLTPAGELPQGGLGSAGDLIGMLGGLLTAR